MAERDWKAVSLLLGDSEGKPSNSGGKMETRKNGIIVITNQEPARVCPFWNDLQISGRVEAVVGFDSLAETVVNIPVSHPANLLGAFPRPRNLNRYLVTIAIMGLSVSLVFAAIASNEARRVQAPEAAIQQHVAELSARLRVLRNNEREMLLLRAQVPAGPNYDSIEMHNVLSEAANAIPDALTLTSLVIDRVGHFEIEALVVGKGFNPERTRDALSRNGFVPDLVNGWIFDNAGGKLQVRGKFHELRQ
jgi:multisubunit Na+/H+ antiporter MnhC subunit